MFLMPQYVHILNDFYGTEVGLCTNQIYFCWIPAVILFSCMKTMKKITDLTIEALVWASIKVKLAKCCKHSNHPVFIPLVQENTYYLKPGTHLGGLFGCHDRPLCTAGTQH